MKISNCEQRSPEWFAIKKGMIGGTRFGQVISNKENRLLFDLLGERLSEYLFPDDYISEEMQFGIDNEDDALQLYTEQTGIQVTRIGAMLSDTSPIHMASPDGITSDYTIVQEVKCTEDIGIHLQRFFKGIDDKHIAQVVNYFAVDPIVQHVDWISYCPACEQKPLVVIRVDRWQYQDKIDLGLSRLPVIESKLDEMYNQIVF